MGWEMSQIVKASKDDLKNIAKVHKKVYSKSHFTSLFSLELLEVFYSYFLNSGSSILLAVDDKKDIQGFIVSGIDISDKISKFKSEERFNIWLTALLHPVTATKKMITQIYNKLFIKHQEYNEADYLILSIAVAVQRKGIGSSLLNEVTLMSQKQEYKNLGLYVRVGNISALNLYLKDNYKIIAYTSDQYYMEKEN